MRHTNYKPTGNTCLFESELKTEKRTKLGNPLEKLSKVVDFEMFRPQLEEILHNKEKDYSKGGARPYDVVLMFKIIVLQQLYNLSDDQMEYQLNDRISFRNFVGLSSGDKVPDAKTIWLYNNNLSQSEAVQGLFDQFSAYLREKGFYLNAGQNFFADSAYVGDNVYNVLAANDMVPQVVERAYRGKPLTEVQKKVNKLKSRIRARVEHVYGYMEVGMNRMFSRRIGMARNCHFIGMRNLVYNMMRLGQLVKYA